MNTLFNIIFTPYLKQYFKNIEHLDLSIKDSKLKIDSLVPHYDIISNLLNLERLNLKIESGLFKNIVIEFPINVLKNNIRISIKSIDFYISEIDHHEKFRQRKNSKSSSNNNLFSEKNNNNNNNIDFDLKSSSSPRSNNSGNNINNSNYNDESFFFKAKDDILSNFIIKIEEINLYFFNSNNIIKFEVSNLTFSPCDLENEDFEFSETFIKGVKRPELKYRKTLIIDKIKASLQHQLLDEDFKNTNSDKKAKIYFIKYLKIVANFYYENKISNINSINTNTFNKPINKSNSSNNFNLENEGKIEQYVNTIILFDNFLFDYDICDSKLLLDIFKRLKHNITINNNQDDLNDFNYIKENNLFDKPDNENKNFNSKDTDRYNDIHFTGISYLDVLKNQINNSIENYIFDYYNLNIFFNNSNINFYHNDFNDILFCFVVNNLNLKINTNDKKESLSSILQKIKTENEEKDLIKIRSLLDKVKYNFDFDKIFIIIPLFENEKRNSKWDLNLFNDYANVNANNFNLIGNLKHYSFKKESSISNIKIILKGDLIHNNNNNKTKTNNFKYGDVENSLHKKITLSMKIIDNKGKKKIFYDDVTILIKIFNEIFLKNLKENDDLYFIKKLNFNTFKDIHLPIQDEKKELIKKKDDYIILVDQYIKCDFNNVCMKIDNVSLFSLICTFYNLGDKIGNLLNDKDINFNSENKSAFNLNSNNGNLEEENFTYSNRSIKDFISFMKNLKEKFLSKEVNYDTKLKAKINNFYIELGEYIEANEKTMFVSFSKLEVNNFKVNYNKKNEWNFVFNKNQQKQETIKIKKNKINKENRKNNFDNLFTSLLKVKFSMKLIINNMFTQNKIELLENLNIKLKKTIYSKFYFLIEKKVKNIFDKMIKKLLIKVKEIENPNSEISNMDIISNFRFLEQDAEKINQNYKFDLCYSIEQIISRAYSKDNKEIYNKKNSILNPLDLITSQITAEYLNANLSDLKINFNPYAYNFLICISKILISEIKLISKNIIFSNKLDSLENYFSKLSKKCLSKTKEKEDNNKDNHNTTVPSTPKSQRNTFNASNISYSNSSNKSFSNLITYLSRYSSGNSIDLFYSNNLKNINSKKDFYIDGFISTLFNCSGYILEIKSFNENISQLLKPNEKIYILHRYITINISINDVFYKKTLDLLQIYLSLCSEDALNPNIINNSHLQEDDIRIDYLKIDLTEKENKTKKFFNLFYRYNSKTKNKIDFFIFDNVLIINNFPNLNYYSILHYILDKSNEISSSGQFNSDNYNLSFGLVSSMKNKFNLVDEDNPSPILAFLSDNLFVKNYLLSEIEFEVNYKDKNEVINISSKEENSLMISKDDLISVFMVVKIPSDFHLKNMLDNSSNKIYCYKSDDIKSVFTGDIYGSYMVKVFYKNSLNSFNNLDKENNINLNNLNNLNNTNNPNNTNNTNNNSRFLLVNLVLEEFLKSHLFYKRDCPDITNKTSGGGLITGKNLGNNKNYLFDENKIFGSPLKIVKVLPDLEIRKFTDENLFDFYFTVNDFCDKFPSDDIIYEKNNARIRKVENKENLFGNENIEFDELNCEFHNNLYQINENNSSYILPKSIEYTNNVKFDFKKIRIGIKFKEDFLENSQIKKIYEEYKNAFSEIFNNENYNNNTFKNEIDIYSAMNSYTNKYNKDKENNELLIIENEIDKKSQSSKFTTESNSTNTNFISFFEFCELLNLKFFDRFFFSKTISTDNFESTNNICNKDDIFSIKLFDDFVVFFRIKIKKYFNYIWSITISSFMNFSIKNSKSLKNLKIESNEKIELTIDKSNLFKRNFIDLIHKQNICDNDTPSTIKEEHNLIEMENSQENNNLTCEKSIKEKLEEFTKRENKIINFDFLNKKSNILLENTSFKDNDYDTDIDIIGFNYLNMEKINNIHIPFDNIYNMKENKLNKNILIDLQDLQSFVSLVKSIKTNFYLVFSINNNRSIDINDFITKKDFKEYSCYFNFESLFLNEKYQLNSTAKETNIILDKYSKAYKNFNLNNFSNNDDKEYLKIQNKIFNCRLIYSPYLITEFYSERFIHKDNLYFIIENHADFDLKIQVKEKKEKEMLINCSANSHSEFVLFSSLDSLMLSFNLLKFIKKDSTTNLNNEDSILEELIKGEKDFVVYLMRFSGENIFFKKEIEKINHILIEEINQNFYIEVKFDISVNHIFVKILKHEIQNKKKRLNENKTETNINNSSNTDPEENTGNNCDYIFEEGVIIEKKNLYSFSISNISIKLNYIPCAELTLFSKFYENKNNTNIHLDFNQSSIRNFYNYQAYYQKNNRVKLLIDKIFGNININNVQKYSLLIGNSIKNKIINENVYLNTSNYKKETLINISFTNIKLQREQLPNNNQNIINKPASVRTEKTKVIIFETKFLTDFKLDIEEIINSIVNNQRINNKIMIHENTKYNINKNIFYKVKMNFPLEMNLTIDDAIFNIFSIFQSQISKEFSNKYLNEILKINQNNRLKKLAKIRTNILISGINIANLNKLSFLRSLSNNIFDNLILPSLKKNLIFFEISLNDFSIKLNIEYKKGLDLSVKNSVIANKSKKIKELICSSELILEEIKNSFFANFFTNLYNLIKGTELFGNYNQFVDEVKCGFEKFKERPLTTGIFSLFYSSIKGGINSFFGVGKSITNTISLNLNRQKNFNSEIYQIFANYIRDFLLNSSGLELMHLNIYSLFEKILPKNQVVSLINKIISKKLISENKNDNLSIVDNLTFCNINNLNANYNLSNNDINENSFLHHQYILKMNKFSTDFLVEKIYADFLNYFDDYEKYEIKYIFKCKKNDVIYFTILTRFFICVIEKDDLITIIPYCQINSSEINKNENLIKLKNGNSIVIEFENEEEMNILIKEIKNKFVI